jgi:hypothetical protein
MPPNCAKQLPLTAPYETLISPVIEDKIREVEVNARITVKTNTVVARIAGQPGEFTVTLKKPGEKIPFDVPFPLPDEMKVDESGKELDVPRNSINAIWNITKAESTSSSWIRMAKVSAPCSGRGMAPG